MANLIHTLNVDGMSCGGCSSRLTGVLENTPGIIKAEVSHEAGSAIVTSNEGVSKETVIQAIENAGFSASE
jgi:copper chaperone